MAYGLCDVPQCEEQTYMGWRPVTERRGRQICESHFSAHKGGRFSLYDAFGFQRPPTMTKTVRLKDYCTCGKELQPGHKLCDNCAAERERQRKREYYHRKKQKQDKGEIAVTGCTCFICSKPREPNHRYCPECTERQNRKSNRIRQRRHYKKKRVCETA